MIKVAVWVAKATAGTLVIMPWLFAARALHTGGAACEAIAYRIEDSIFKERHDNHS
jgi:hypothetical protein